MSSGIALAGSALYSVTEGWRRARESKTRREGIKRLGGKGERETGYGGEIGTGVGGRRKAVGGKRQRGWVGR